MVNVLVATYGNPWKFYSEQGYDYAWDERLYKLGTACDYSRTTLPLLYNVYNPDKVIIIVQDSVVYEVKNINNSYENLIKSVENLFKKFLNEICNGKCKGLDEEKLKIVVAPGIGYYSNRIDEKDKNKVINIGICGGLDFYGYVISTLAVELIEIIKEKRPDKLQVILDTTHGINYMPVLTYRALREILSVISLTPFLKQISLIVHNTAPVYLPSGGGSETALNVTPINKIEESIIKYVDESENKTFAVMPNFEAIPTMEFYKMIPINEECIQKSSSINADEIKNEIENKISGLMTSFSNEYLKQEEKEQGIHIFEKLSAFAGSIVNGLPLVLLYTIPNVELKNFYTDIFDKIYKNYVKVHLDSSYNRYQLNIIRLIKLTENFISLFKILTAAKALTMDDELVKLLKNNSNEYTLNDMKILRNKIFSINEKLSAIIDNELEDMKEKIQRKNPQECKNLICEDDWILYACTLAGPKKELNEREFERNFLAHAGLERNVTCYKFDDQTAANDLDSKIKIKYKSGKLKIDKLDKSIIEEIYQFSQAGLQRYISNQT